MMMLCSSSCLQMALSRSLFVMVVLYIGSVVESKECGLQMTEKMRARSVVMRNTDMKLCLLDCIEDGFIFALCRRLSDETAKTGESNVRPKGDLKAPDGHCGSNVCNETSQCVEKGCEMICLEAPPLCDLHIASKIGDVSKVKGILSRRQTDINCQEWIGRTPVIWAALSGHKEVVELLVIKGANVELIDRFGTNILHSACLGGDVEVVKYVLSQNMVYIDGRAQCKRTPLMLAAENGHREVVELLVREGAEMSLVDENGDNILHCACRGGHVKTVKYIVSQGKVYINSRGWKKKTPVMLAAEGGHKDMVEFLVQHGADLSLVYASGSGSLHLASYKGQLEVVKYIVSKGKVKINSRGWRKMTPLMLAANGGHKDVVEFLIQHGADLSLVSSIGSNTLHSASSKGHLNVVKYIVSTGKVKINSRGTYQKTPVMLAAEGGQKDVVEFLVRHGADLSLVYSSGSNILHLASFYGHLEVVKYIVSKGKVNINSRGHAKKTPIMLAAETGKTDVVEFLVEHGADLSLVCAGGDNILHLACKSGHLETVKYIVSQDKLDINRKGSKLKTALMMAIERGHKKVVDFLSRVGNFVLLE